MERDEVMKEIRNRLQELAKENTMAIEERDSIVSDEREEQTQDPTYTEGK